MANEFYVTIDGVTTGRFHGETTKEGHKGKITGLEFFYEVKSPRDAATGLPTGKRQHKPVAFTKEWGAASPQLFRSLVTNETLTSVLFEFVKTAPDGKEEISDTIKLTGASVSDFRRYIGNVDNFTYDSTSEDRRLETVSFTFRTIEVTNNTSKTTAVDDFYSAV
ncbi:MAG TPA: type VI secretion system tube protein TssD [Micropepsaceae bacterium]|nr:type VI secretion system tube protein TssD [Micropepsaceae bacterium]